MLTGVRGPLFRLLTMLLVGVAAACVASDGPTWLAAPELVPVDSAMRLRSGSFVLAVGDAASVLATATSILGRGDQPRALRWFSDDEGIATVDPYGTVTGHAPGRVRILAVDENDRRAVLQVVVAASTPPIARLVVSPATVTIAAGSSARLTIQALDSTGVPIAGVVPTFASDSPHVATVRATTTRTRELNQVYLISALRAGVAHVTVSALGATATSRVVVTPAAKPVVQVTLSPSSVTLIGGDSVRVTAQALDDAGHAVTGAVVTFDSEDPARVTIDQAGMVRALAPGNTRISANTRGLTAFAPVVVVPRVAQLTLSLPASTLVVGSTTRLVVRAVDAQARELPDAAITFTSSDSAVARVDATGAVTAVSIGTAQLRVTSQYQSAAVTVFVEPRPVSNVVLTPASLSLVVGGTAQLLAQARDATDAIVAAAAITFTSNAPSIATVSAAGLVTAIAPGTAQVIATSQGVSSAATVVVTPRPVTQVILTPSSLSLSVGASGQLSAQARDETDAPVSGATITFASTTPAIATVSPTGTVTALAPGSAQITATSQGISAAATVVVSPRPVSSVTVTPSALDLVVGGSASIVAQARDATGAVVPTAAITFSSDAPSVAGVSANGVVVGISPGSTAIRATSNGITATASVVVAAPPSGLVIDVAPGTTYQTMSGWEATAEIGSTECNATAYQVYRNPLLDRAVNELGINRVRLEVTSGIEHPTDRFALWQSGQLNTSAYFASRYQPVNDNADPLVTDLAGFHFSSIDHTIEQIVNPLRQRMAARGEALMVNLNFVDFKTTRAPFNQMEAPGEYAELIVATFQHMQQKYGWVPDAVELLLEPENTPWSGTRMGQALVAAASRLRALGWTPEFIGPSTTASAAAPEYWDAMRAVPGAAPLLKELAYHRYDNVTSSTLAAIDSRRNAHQVRTAMLEHIGSGIDDLIDDLTLAGVSAWQQFALAFCVGVDDGSAYYMIDESAPANPSVRLSATGRLLSQVFRYVRAGAVRIGANSADSGLASTVAFRNTNGKHVVVVRTHGAMPLQVRGLPPGTYGVSYGTAGGTDQGAADVVVGVNGTAFVSIPGAGAITLFAR